MRRTLLIPLLIVSLLLSFCSCNETALTIDTASVTSINLQAADGNSLSITQTDDLQPLLQALQDVEAKTTGSTEALSDEQYRLTLLQANETPLSTITVFSNTLLQVDTQLYQGDTTKLLAILSSYYQVTALDTLTSLFTSMKPEPKEIAFHNLTTKTFKIITGKQDLTTLAKALQGLTLQSDTVGSTADTQESFRLYIRYEGKNAYEPPLVFTKQADTWLLTCGVRRCTVSFFDFQSCYQALSYNEMPLV